MTRKDSERRKAYYQAHKGEIRARNKAYREAHKEEVKAYSKAYDSFALTRGADASRAAFPYRPLRPDRLFWCLHRVQARA